MNISPALYLKNIKMMAIHDELQRNKSFTIGEFLQKFKINHAGHYGQYYKEYFQQIMQQTRHQN
ncbi:MAG: hypothetical protein MK132_11665 [Lentisphaerales bacterium]|nr:hypothetical protein [Lentisphaerales bacterium]